MVVYLDLLFLWNLVIDGLLLLATAWIRRKPVRWLRLAAAAGLGASYTLFLLWPQMSLLFTFGAKLMVSIGMVLLAFGFGGTLTFLRTFGSFYLVNFVAAGASFGLHYFFLTQAEALNGIWISRSGGLRSDVTVGVGLVVVGIPAGLYLLRKLLRSTQQQEELTHFLTDVQIQVEDRTFACTALIDTGNRLYDPLTKTPVMVMETSLWLPLLPEAWIQRIRKNEVDLLVSGLEQETFIWQDRLRLVPYRGINKGTQFMLAIKPDSVRISYNGKQWETARVLIGLDAGKLSEDGAYQAILHPDLLKLEAAAG